MTRFAFSPQDVDFDSSSPVGWHAFVRGRAAELAFISHGFIVKDAVARATLEDAT
jgi:hypothetical protein